MLEVRIAFPRCSSFCHERKSTAVEASDTRRESTRSSLAISPAIRQSRCTCGCSARITSSTSFLHWALIQRLSDRKTSLRISGTTVAISSSVSFT
ncbi:hypothetical protein [Bacteroides thetaiotaomicron]|uniref:hypothetical protein n=1 Tax=Bacteroides thetaiotaomicron TaxID=818 RepID=UPI00232EF066|nr:hypothetical protein [Bacteroides thetaiotaomicron]